MIRITTTSPFIDFAARGHRRHCSWPPSSTPPERTARLSPLSLLSHLVTTFVSGVIFMVIKMAMLGVVGELAAAMLPVVAMTAVFNAILVGALYLPIQKALKLN